MESAVGVSYCLLCRRGRTCMSERDLRCGHGRSDRGFHHAYLARLRDAGGRDENKKGQVVPVNRAQNGLREKRVSVRFYLSCRKCRYGFGRKAAGMTARKHDLL